MSPTRFASEHKWIYIGAIVVLLALVVIGLVRYAAITTNNKATQKANELADAAVAAGYRRPDTALIAGLLGTDGGLVCDDPASALKSALWKINVSNGAAFVGQRPVIGDGRALAAEATIMKIYCPDKLDKIQDKLDDLKTDDTVRQ
ncbi:hypothetical protein ACWGKW_29940 [Streptomyces sp. NPDC054766]|uniref:hypothetical protein n=1 Tax=Streptomyces rhizosphaerihabitans TaxID=1266770 RepID=UPI0021BE2888|nr:hypothetical protein [Streptomyces rhizosphaerihabitans]MCT9008205.1 hypothetical protein [Streptomyces rhizosphaerihabitans]WRZ91715.1 hypothetical protein OHB54_23135 [Streptomyces sp. NBC_01007]